MKKSHLSILIVLAVLIVDQVLKVWIKTSMVLGQEIRIADWFIIHFTENNGMAFGLEFGEKAGKYFLTGFRLVACGAIIYFIKKLILSKAPTGVIVGFSLILAGALGNIIDSVFYGMIFSESIYKVAEVFPEGGGYSSIMQGRVVDMFYFPLIKTTYPSWSPINAGDPFIFFRPVFNVADASISVAIGYMLIFQRKFFQQTM